MSLVTIARFLDLPAAHIAKGVLEQHGFFVVLMDDAIAGNAWADMLAIGGVRLAVPEEEVEGAKSCLQETEAQASRAPPDPEQKCPKCGGTKILRPRSLISLILSYCLFLLPLPLSLGRRVCGICRHSWTEHRHEAPIV